MSSVHAFFTKRKSLSANTNIGETEILEQLRASNGDKDVESCTQIKRQRCELTSSSTPSSSSQVYHIAVNGCCHGELDTLYEACKAHEMETGKKIQLLLCCGDFQAVRNEQDLENMAVPAKYRRKGDFHKYHNTACSCIGSTKLQSGQYPTYRIVLQNNTCHAKPDHVEETHIAPYLTIFIGGNHENSDWLAEESYGGFVAPNIYYLGHSGVITVDNVVRIAGLSGIYNSRDYEAPYPARPYSQSEGAKRSAYHVRSIEVKKLETYFSELVSENVKSDTVLQQYSTNHVDIMLSHDWPSSITKYGNEAQLLRYKPFFSNDIAHGTLGNPHSMKLMELAQPSFWFAGHLHCRFEAHVKHKTWLFQEFGNNNLYKESQLEEIKEHQQTNKCSSLCKTHCDANHTVSRKQRPQLNETFFLALDKCGKSNCNNFLEFIDIPIHTNVDAKNATSLCCGINNDNNSNNNIMLLEGATRICRDARWVEILRTSHPFVASNAVQEFCESKNNNRELLKFSDFVTTPEKQYNSKITVSDNKDSSSVNENNNNVDSCTWDTQHHNNNLLHAATTSALLNALHLQPALPLQMKWNPSDFNNRGNTYRSNYENKEHKTSRDDPSRHYGESEVKTETKSSDFKNDMKESEQLNTLEWAEDLSASNDAYSHQYKQL